MCCQGLKKRRRKRHCRALHLFVVGVPGFALLVLVSEIVVELSLRCHIDRADQAAGAFFLRLCLFHDMEMRNHHGLVSWFDGDIVAVAGGREGDLVVRVQGLRRQVGGRIALS
jgi:hypothetical protein